MLDRAARPVLPPSLHVLQKRPRDQDRFGVALASLDALVVLHGPAVKQAALEVDPRQPSALSKEARSITDAGVQV